MQALQFQKKAYSVTFSESGKVLQLRDTKNQSVDWSANTEVNSFGLPFINGSQEAEVPVPCDLATKTQSQAVFQSLSGCTSVSWEMGEEQLKLEYRNVPDCGPRMGLQLDLNLLDLNTGAPLGGPVYAHNHLYRPQVPVRLLYFYHLRRSLSEPLHR